jgi:hypothetical protein
MKRIPLERRIAFIIAGERTSGNTFWIITAANRITRLVSQNYRRRKR